MSLRRTARRAAKVSVGAVAGAMACVAVAIGAVDGADILGPHVQLPQAIETSPEGSVVCVSAVIAAPVRSSPAVTSTEPPVVSVPDVPMPHVIAVECESPQPRAAAMKTMQIPLMCAQRTHRRAKLHWNRVT